MKKAIALLLATCVSSLAATIATAADNETPTVQKAVAWSDKAETVRVFFVNRDNNRYSLFVVGNKDYSVVYRTSRNSSEAIRRELTPKQTIGNVQEYELDHHFSRTTIWMAVEFVKKGQRSDELTRTFYGSIEKVVPNGQFIKEKP